MESQITQVYLIFMLSEFLTANVNKANALSIENLELCFKMLDKVHIYFKLILLNIYNYQNGDGKLSLEEL